MLLVTKKKKKKPDADSHFTFLTTPASSIILGRDNFLENRKNRKEEDEIEVATEAEREREEVQCSEWDRDKLSTCPQIIRCLGEDHSVENSEKFYNVFLEYAFGGNLTDQVKNRGGLLPKFDVRWYAKSILLGLHEIHAKRFVHCDIKLQNILVFGNGAIKIADFGLAKKAEKKQST
jgi:serine/threonine protein kinase